MLIRPDQGARSSALFELGFRPFFLLAGFFALASIFIWGGVFVYDWPRSRLPFMPMLWHAHEMIFGYGMAVVAGFLLTAVRNWTRIQTPHGYSLASLAALWCAARLGPWMIPDQILPMLLSDLAFDLWLLVAILYPILRARQRHNIGVVSKLALLALANLCFYLGVAGVLEQGIAWGLYSGLYVLLALVFTLVRRVMPMFIERGVDYPLSLPNHKWLDRSSLFFLVLFVIADVFWRHAPAAALLAGAIFVVHSMRLAGWYTHGIWNRPLLWVLYLGYAGAVFGFLLKACTPFVELSPSLPLHAFSIGGIGLISAGMMARISLGHTGRDVREHSPLLAPIFVLLIVTWIARVILPVIAPAHYLLWVGIAQASWMIAFASFLWIYAPILFRPRVDGRGG